MKKKDTSGGSDLVNDAFGGLNIGGLPDAPLASKAAEPAAPKAKPGRMHLRIEKSGRSGKTVTVVFGEGVTRFPADERESFLKSLKNTLGCGGAVAGDMLELQGDVRERLTERLRALGHVK